MALHIFGSKIWHCQILTCSVSKLGTVKFTPTRHQGGPATGFTIPYAWCNCVMDHTTGTYWTQPFVTGSELCSFGTAYLRPETLTPAPAHITTASAVVNGAFYNELARCAVSEDGAYPLMTDAKSLSASSACNYTTPPPSRAAISPLSVTTCSGASTVLASSIKPLSSNSFLTVTPSSGRVFLYSRVRDELLFGYGWERCLRILHSVDLRCLFPHFPANTTARGNRQPISQPCGFGKSQECTFGEDCVYTCFGQYVVSRNRESRVTAAVLTTPSFPVEMYNNNGGLLLGCERIMS